MPLNADQGVRISAGQVDVNDALTGGDIYRLPDLVVSNPGTEPAQYQMSAGPVAGQAEIAVEPGWVTFTPATFSLDPGGQQSVAIQVAIPAGALAGSYLGYLKAQLVPGTTGLAIGPAAATRLTFRIVPSSGLDAALSSVRRWLDGAGPWPAVVLAIASVLLLARLVRRRWSLRIERRG